MWKLLLLGAPVGVFQTAYVFCCMCVSVYCSLWKHLLLGAPVGVFHTARAVVLYVCFSVLQASMWKHLLLGVAGPDGSFVSTGACNLGVLGSNPGRDGYLSSWLCIYSAPNC